VRIGDLLLERRALSATELDLALDEQRRAGGRLCSLLISRGAIEFDDGARALADQLGVPCALAKHLAHRDPTVAHLIPAELGRASCALPLGRTSGGALIVAVRDPAPALRSALEQAARIDVMMVVAPASRLEHLIAASYGATPHDEFDVEVESAVDLPISPGQPPLPDLAMLDPDSIRASLSSLDDERVAKDHSQSAMPLLSSPGLRVRSTLPPVAPTLDATCAALERATTREAATDLALAFVAGRWLSGLVLAIRGPCALGYRGHAIEGAIELELPLDATPVLQNAVATRAPVTQPPGPQDRLGRALRAPSALTAVPIVVAGEVIAVLATGDTIHMADAKAPNDLARLGEALGAAYDRIRRG
jgi:type II secretion system (T2SS) protein E